MDFGVLGPVEVRAGGAAVALGGTRERYVLAMLVLGAGRPVSGARIVDALWDDPPPTARPQLHNVVSRLRRAVGRADLIVTGTGGYELRLHGDDTVDLRRFRALVTEGRHALAAGDAAVAADLFGAALALWRGPALADVPDELAGTVRHGLHEERLSAAEARLEALVAVGRHAEALAELAPVLAEHPYRENLYQVRMVALAGAGRRTDALDTYRLARARLVAGLGIEPGPALRDLEQRILRGEDVTAGAAPARVVARQLPPPTAVLTGRDELVGEVREALVGGAALAVLTGPGGVGKTTVALAAATEAAGVFTGGQLYADLRGSQGTPADPHVIAGRFLHALGVRQPAVPTDPGERVAVYRGLLARTRTLVVLDDAGSAEQVRALLPGDPGCAVLVTSRRRLAGLSDATGWSVPGLSDDAVLALFTRIVGAERVAAEPGAAAGLARVCGRLPLAVSIVAARLAERPDWTLAEFAERLERERDRLDELAVGDLDVRASIGSSYGLLSPGGRRLLRLLGLVAAEDWPGWVPGALLGAPAAAPLAELVDVHLVERAGDRHRLHDLVAAFAREQVHATEEQDERTAAVTRVLTGWLALAVAADGRVPHGEAFPLPVTTGPPPVPVTEPYAWFDTERPGLLVAVEEAARLGRADLAGHLALHLSGYLELRCLYDDWLTALRRAIEPARAAGEDALLVRLLTALFAAHGLADRFTELPGVAAEELAAARRLGDRAAEITALGHAGRAARDNGRFPEAATLLAEALAMAQTPPVETKVLVDALVGNAVLHIKAGRPEQALEELTEATATDTLAGSTARAVLYRYLSGLALLDLDRLDEAEKTLLDGLATCEAIGDDVGTAYLTWSLANVDLRAGRARSAAGRLDHALRAAERLGAQDAIAEVLRSLGDLAAAQGRHPAARDALHRSLAIWRGLGVLQTARTLARLEYVHHAMGDHAAAVACHREWHASLTGLALDERCLRLPPFMRSA